MTSDKAKRGVVALVAVVLMAAGSLLVSDNRDSNRVPANESRSTDESPTEPANQRPWTVWYGGRLECRDAVTVRCQVEGPADIVSILNDGTAVKKGDLVVELSDKYLREYQGELRARLARLRRRLKSARTKPDRKKLKQRVDWTTAELKRIAGMFPHCRVFAPRDGVVFPSHVWYRSRAIDYRLEPGVTVREGQYLFQVCDVARFQVRVGVLNSNINKVKIGMPATLRFQGMRKKPLRGRVIGISDKQEPGPWPNTDFRLYDVLLAIEGDTSGLIPRLRCEVEFNSRHE